MKSYNGGIKMEYMEDTVKENDLRKKTSEELLHRYGRYKMFLGDETNEASPVAFDIDIECKLIYSILMERLNKNDGGTK